MQDRTNQIVQGIYHGIEYCGIITRSRVKPNQYNLHTVALFEPIDVYGEKRDTVLIDESSNFSVQETVEPNPVYSSKMWRQTDK